MTPPTISHHKPHQISVLLLTRLSISTPSYQTSITQSNPQNLLHWGENIHRNGPRFVVSRTHKYHPGIFVSPSNLLFIIVSLSTTPFMKPNTRKKNKSTHPGIPNMTPSQLSSAGLSHTPATRHKKQTKDQQIAALKDELRTVRELISNVTRFTLPHIIMPHLYHSLF